MKPDARAEGGRWLAQAENDLAFASLAAREGYFADPGRRPSISSTSRLATRTACRAASPPRRLPGTVSPPPSDSVFLILRVRGL